eukprot:2224515-Pyramimonas_sp.AAC.1
MGARQIGATACWRRPFADVSISLGCPTLSLPRQRGRIMRDAGRIFSRRTNRTQVAQVYSHDGPIGRKSRRYILTTDPSDASRA